jgi:hypothetical protein
MPEVRKVQEAAWFPTRANERQGGLRRKAHVEPPRAGINPNIESLNSKQIQSINLQCSKRPCRCFGHLNFDIVSCFEFRIPLSLGPSHYRQLSSESTRPPTPTLSRSWESAPKGLRDRDARRIPSPLPEPVSAYSRTGPTCEEKANVPFPLLVAVGYHASGDGSSRFTDSRFRRGSWIISSYSAISAS